MKKLFVIAAIIGMLLMFTGCGKCDLCEEFKLGTTETALGTICDDCNPFK